MASTDENRSTKLDETGHGNFFIRLMDSTVVGQSTIDDNHSTDRIRVGHNRVSNRLSCLGVWHMRCINRSIDASINRLMFETVRYFYLARFS